MGESQGPFIVKRKINLYCFGENSCIFAAPVSLCNVFSVKSQRGPVSGQALANGRIRILNIISNTERAASGIAFAFISVYGPKSSAKIFE